MADETARPASWHWPLGLAVALAAMIGTSLAVLGIAIANPDPPVAAHPLAAGAAPPRASD
jgi:hypothetical protein